MRILLFLALACAGCTANTVPGQNDQSEAKQVEMNFYKRRVASNGEIIPPPVLTRLSGTLAERNGCLILVNGQGSHALVFQEGLASFNGAERRLSAGSAEIMIGEPISVGGPFSQPSEDFDPLSVQQQCGVGSVWLVTGQDVKSSP